MNTDPSYLIDARHNEAEWINLIRNHIRGGGRVHLNLEPRPGHKVKKEEGFLQQLAESEAFAKTAGDW